MSNSLQSVVLNNGKAPVKVDFLHTKKAALILRSINHKLRQQIIKLLDESQKMTVTEIYVKLNYTRLAEVVSFVETLVG